MVEEPRQDGDQEAPAQVRDKLAAIRTDLANERTLLAYLRTGLALVIGAVTANHFLHDPAMRLMALALGVLGVIALGFGAWRFVFTRRSVRRAERDR